MKETGTLLTKMAVAANSPAVNVRQKKERLSSLGEGMREDQDQTDRTGFASRLEKTNTQDPARNRS